MNKLKEELENEMKSTSQSKQEDHDIGLWENLFAGFLPKITEVFFQDPSVNLKQFIDEIFLILNKVKIAKE